MSNRSLPDGGRVEMPAPVNVVLLTRTAFKLRAPLLTVTFAGSEEDGSQGCPLLHFMLSGVVPLNSSAKVKAQFVPAGSWASRGCSRSSMTQATRNETKNQRRRRIDIEVINL